ncbi:hypothetical protein AN644_01705 [Candidatus Epulonipiscium fishelsonii]|nr:hypothetical protein AN644_01705 [Epulopiscium sp. SCG-C06WGA-EpuloA1]
MRTKICDIVVEEFYTLITSIEKDFGSNYKRKVNNFLLSQMDEHRIANMVFASSFESKSGFAIETCAKRIARLRFGNENVPTIVNPHNLPLDINANEVKGQIILTNINIINGNLKGEICAYRANNMVTGSGKNRKESTLTQSSIKRDLLPLAKKFKTNVIHAKAVDLAFFDGTNWNVCELKAGGDLDSSNAPSNVEKLLNIYIAMDLPNCNAYFATLYNKDGEGNTWKGTVKKHMNYPSMFLIGAKFWNKILPIGITFSDFIEIYATALKELNLNQRMNSMINKCINNM